MEVFLRDPTNSGWLEVMNRDQTHIGLKNKLQVTKCLELVCNRCNIKKSCGGIKDIDDMYSRVVTRKNGEDNYKPPGDCLLKGGHYRLVW